MSNSDNKKPRRIWSLAKMLIAFHTDKRGNRRDDPTIWAPKNGAATLRDNPDEQEVFVQLQSEDGSPERDLQIKLRPDLIALTRDHGMGWNGVMIDEHELRVVIGDTIVKIARDGSITRYEDEYFTSIEANGEVLKVRENLEASISGDGVELARRTDNHLAAITHDGVISRER